MPNLFDPSVNDTGQVTLAASDVLLVQQGGTSVSSPGDSNRTRFDNLQASVLQTQYAEIATQTLPGKATPNSTATLTTYFEVYTFPSGASGDIEICNIQFVGTSSFPIPKYTFQMWSGIPNATGSTLLYDYGSTEPINSIYFNAATPIFITNTGSSAPIYCLVKNLGAAPWIFTALLKYRIVRTNAPILTIPTTPAPYSGSLLATVNVGPGKQFATPSAGILALANGGTMNVYAGTYYDVFTIPVGIQNYTITGQGTNNTFFDGQGGIGNGYRLKYGKGFIVVESPPGACYIKNIAFWNCGGADNIGDGEAAVYFDCFSMTGGGTVNLQYCSFDNCEDGIFASQPNTWATAPDGTAYQIPPVNGGSTPYIFNLVNCDFGFTEQNGITIDGLSHDTYVQVDSFNITNSHFYAGSKFGNCIKSRSAALTVTNGFIRHDQGRVIDAPNGGSLTVTGTTITATVTAVANWLGYGNENNYCGYVNPVFTNCPIIGVRYQDSLWICAEANISESSSTPSSTIECMFSGCSQSWVSESGISSPGFILTPASTGTIQTYNAGTNTGLQLTPPNGYTFVAYPTLPAQASLPANNPPT